MYGNAINLLLYKTTGLLVTELILKKLSNLLLKKTTTPGFYKIAFSEVINILAVFKWFSSPAITTGVILKVIFASIPFFHLLLF